ncbi:Eco29kI family restriction endonuclease [Sphingomonas sp.]|uniref:Eco29kI family restriction endonuclease n=1 Tax=Sphingomonas sp. TaxID=28214 RepID=UPI00286EA7A8|nr:Eco29kI family restriction endonuclease [Sphingomonas sp.]
MDGVALLRQDCEKQVVNGHHYYDGELSYIGKATKTFTKSGRTLRDRLNEHLAKLKAYDLDLDRVSCRYLVFQSDWWVVAAEVALIRHLNPPWNGSGLGSKTPGEGRPGTDRVSLFDQLFSKKPTLPT